MKKFFMIFTLVAAMQLSAATALAAVPSIMDNAKLLSNGDKAKVERVLQQVENKYNVRVGVVTVKSIGTKKPGDFANELIDKAYNNGPNGNMVLLQVVDQRKWYVSTDKKLKSVVVGNEGVEYMSKAFVPYLKKNDYAGAYTVYATKAGELLNYYQKNGKGWKPEKGFPLMALLGALVAGVAGAYLYRGSLLSSMSNVRQQVEANAYLNKESFNLLVTNDTYMYTNVSVVPRGKSKDNDSDGSVTESSSDDNHGGGGGGY